MKKRLADTPGWKQPRPRTGWVCVCGARLTVDHRDVEVLDVKTDGVWHVEVSCRCGRRVRITKASVIVLGLSPRKTIIRKKGD